MSKPQDNRLRHPRNGFFPHVLCRHVRLRALAIMLLMLGVGVPYAQYVQDDSEPNYNGKPLSHWVRVLEIGGLHSSRLWPEINEIDGGREAENALRYIGTNAIPFLLKSFEPFPNNNSCPRGVMLAFRGLGSVAHSAIPTLAFLVTNQVNRTQQLEDTETRNGTENRFVRSIGHCPLTALGWIGPDALPALLTILSNYPISGIQHSVIEAITSMGTNACAAAPALMECVTSRNEIVVHSAIGALGVTHRGQESVFIFLTNILQSQPELRTGAIEALPRFGENAVPPIINVLRDCNDGTRYIAGNTLRQFAPSAFTNATLLKLIGDFLHSSDTDKRYWAALMLRTSGQVASGKRPMHLAEMHRGSMDSLYHQATNTLQQLTEETTQD